tara:strand:+ start:4784 stop:5938 length:1155 start_codon:yes stop_codon:yes gene_type:complete
MPGFELIGKEEKKQIESIFQNGGVLFRHGFDNLRNGTFKVKEFEEKFAKKMNSKYALAVSSGTAALRVALATLDIKPGDEIITQSFTFVATVEAIIESRAIPVCIDIDKTLNMDPDALEKKINKKTKAIIIVHMLGTPCNVKVIKKICRSKNIALIEDTAWGIGASVKNKYLGTWGNIGTFSFDFAKTITTGEGGMLLFNDKKLYKQAAAWHDHGHENNPSVPRWEDTRSSSGFNFRMTEMQAAVGIAQLKKLEFIVKSHIKNKELITKKLSKFKNIEFREKPENSIDSAEALIFLVKNKYLAIKCRKALLKINVSTKILPEATTWHFAKHWDHMKELKLNKKNKNYLKVSNDLLARAVSIPITVNMKKNLPSQIFVALNKVID